MCDDAPYQPGRRRRTAGGNAARAGLAIAIVMSFLEGPARAQSGTDPAVTIPVHPDVTTTLHLPEEIQRVRFTVEIAGLIGAIKADDMVLIRPRPGIPVGEEVTVTVWTATMRWRLRLRVVQHARDALEDVAVVAPDAEPVASEPAADTSSLATAEPAERAPGATGPPEPSASATTSPASPAAPAAPAPARPASAVATGPEGTDAANDRRDALRVSAVRFELTLQAVAALAGTTELSLAGFKTIDARQSHRAFGVRVAGSPRDARWAVEANVSGEWSAVPTTHRAEGLAVVSGPWLRADVGMRARFRTRVSPTAYAGLGLQWHQRDIQTMQEVDSLRRSLTSAGGWTTSWPAPGPCRT